MKPSNKTSSKTRKTIQILFSITHILTFRLFTFYSLYVATFHQNSTSLGAHDRHGDKREDCPFHHDGKKGNIRLEHCVPIPPITVPLAEVEHLLEADLSKKIPAKKKLEVNDDNEDEDEDPKDDDESEAPYTEAVATAKPEEEKSVASKKNSSWSPATRVFNV